MRFKNWVVGLLLVLFGAICASAQTTTVKGVAKDQQGQLLVDATVQLVDQETGRKFTFKTDKQGEFSSIGVTAGKFNVTLSKDGKTLYTTNFQATLSQEVNFLNLNLQQLATSTQGLTPEQKKQMEEAQKKNEEVLKENVKIKNLNEMLGQSKAAIEAKNYDQAISIMQQATQMDPTKDLLWGRLGEAYLGAKRYPEAVDAYSKAVQIGSRQARPNIKQLLGAYYNNLGQAYAKSAKTQEAIDAYNHAATEDPANGAQYYYNEGAVLTNSGKPDEANSAFDKAIAADPNKADAYYQKGVNLLQKATVDPKTGAMKAPPAVAENLNKYLELQPSGPYAQQAKEILTTLGEKVTTSYKATKKK